ncbi:MAG TPA: GGDEF domain-containing protein [Candidatus Sulfotelmatobacter sp.]|jgi:two-component system cell cycle response regulator|nr:GGDEF domain-containing protein [Candidatus Sulfotelmatobacter sp.]
MNKFRDFLRAGWSAPDPVLAEAGVAGELLVAKVRLSLATLLLLIPVINSIFFAMEPREGLVGISLASGTFFLSVIVYLLISRNYNPSWLGFVSSSFDVTLISSALALFLLANEPHTAVNSKVVFEGYFLAIGSTSLRYDKRICISAGLLAFAQYLAIVYCATSHWDLNSPSFAPYPYGLFSWSAQISRLIMMLTAAGLSLALVSRSQRLLQLAIRDHLTGLFNRAYADDRLAIELSRARRYGTALTVAVIDADRFKALNDTHGHLVGDIVLKKIGELILRSFRQSDTAGRYGGEEFVLILPETDIETGWRKLDLLRELVAATLIAVGQHGQNVQVTISAGLAGFPEDGEDAATLFATADERMFAAKREGRNRVIAGQMAVVA